MTSVSKCARIQVLKEKGKSVFKFKFIAAVIALTVSSAAYAEPDIIVTALRTPTQVENTGTQVTIVEGEQIKNRQTATVAEILATLPGITIDRSGNTGSYSSVRIRGAEGAQTLVLVDGVRMNDVAEPAAGFDFGSLVTGNTNRIEVLRGPSSVLWGSQAVGGVVSLTTRAPSDTLTSTVRGEYGYADTVRSYADLSDTVGPVSYLLGGGYERSDGISAAATGSERDGFRANAVNAKIGVWISDNVNLDFRGNYLGTRFSFDGFPPPTYTLADTGEYSETNSISGYAGINASFFNDTFINRASYSRVKLNRYNYENNDVENFHSSGINERFEYQGAVGLGNNRAVFGYEHEASDLNTRYDYSGYIGGNTAAANVDSLYGQLSTKLLTNLTINAGLRRDWHSGYGNETTFGADGVYVLNNTVFRASYGEGFKAPTLYQLYGDYGNQSLLAETARGWDAGISHRFNEQIDLTVNYFTRNTTNQIDFDLNTYTYGNLNKTSAEGFEVIADVNPIDSLNLSANYTYTLSKDRATGLDLRRRPRHSFSIRGDYVWNGGLATGATVRYSGSSYEDVANTDKLESYVLVDLTARYPITDMVELTARVENIFDENYATAQGYGVYPRAAYLGVRIKN